MKKLFLLLLITLLAFTNAGAETFDPPVEVGDTYEFTQIAVQNCSMPFRTISDELIGVKQIRDWSFLIMEVTTEDKLIKLNSTYTYYLNSEPVTNTVSSNSYYLVDDFVSSFIPSMDVSSNGINIRYRSTMVRNFIEPDFETIYSLITDQILESGANSLLNKADRVEFMGEPTLEEGIEKLESDIREWSIVVDLSSYSSYYDTLVISKEFKYNKDGVLDYNKVTEKVKVAGGDETCFFEEEYKNISSFLASIPGFEIYFPLVFIPMVLLRKFKR